MLRKILSLLHNKIFIVAVLILIQLGVFFGIVFQLSEYFVWIYFLLIALSFIISVYVINRNDNPTYKMTWVLLIMALPVFGLSLIHIFFERLGVSYDDLSFFKEMHADGIRLDEGFDSLKEAQMTLSLIHIFVLVPLAVHLLFLFPYSFP